MIKIIDILTSLCTHFSNKISVFRGEIKGKKENFFLKTDKFSVHLQTLKKLEDLVDTAFVQYLQLF